MTYGRFADSNSGTARMYFRRGVEQMVRGEAAPPRVSSMNISLVQGESPSQGPGFSAESLWTGHESGQSVDGKVNDRPMT